MIDKLCVSIPNFYDICTLKIKLSNKTILVSGIYRCPKADIDHFSDFIYNNFNYFTSLLDMFLIGDFNINIMTNDNKINIS